MPFGLSQERKVLEGLDYAHFYPHLQRVSLSMRGNSLAEKQAALLADVQKVPAWAEPEIMHNQRGFKTLDALRDEVMAARQAGIRHHSFHYYGLSRTYQLEWIGDVRHAWS